MNSNTEAIKPAFSIIIPCFNSAFSIGKAINSIIKQHFSDFEILIIDGVSGDDTVNVVNGFQDNRIKIYSEADLGIYDAMNKGLKLAKGQWLYFLGSDDYLYDKFVLADIFNFIVLNHCRVLYGDVKVSGKNGWAIDGEIYGGEFDFNKFYKNNICHQSIFYNREFIIKHQFNFDLRFPVSADWDFNFKCWQKTRFLYVSRIVAVFQAGGLSSNKDIVEPFHFERRKYLPLRVRLNERIKKLLTIFRPLLGTHNT